MKISKKIITAIVAFISFESIAQESKSYKLNNNFDVAASAIPNQFLGTASWTHNHGVTKSKKFKIGYGVRFNTYFGKDLNYITAPAKLTSNDQGPQVLFGETFPENIDTMFVAQSQLNSVNLMINLQYTFKNKLDVGFNIDAVGLSFGGKTSGTYLDPKDSRDNTQHVLKPTSFNLLLVSDNDLGMLNSEIYARYWFSPKWALKAGASFLFNEYTSENKLRLDNNRWRSKSLMAMIGVTYSPFK